MSASGFGPLSRIWTPLLKSLGVTKLHPAIIDCCLNLDKSAGIPRSTQTATRSAEISVHSSLYSGKAPREVQKSAFLVLLKPPREVQNNVRGFIMKGCWRIQSLRRGSKYAEGGPYPLTDLARGVQIRGGIQIRCDTGRQAFRSLCDVSRTFGRRVSREGLIGRRRACSCLDSVFSCRTAGHMCCTRIFSNGTIGFQTHKIRISIKSLKSSPSPDANESKSNFGFPHRNEKPFSDL